MIVKYVAVYSMRGVNKLPDGETSVALLRLREPTLSATLTSEAERYFLHVDKSAAIGSQLLRGLFTPDTVGKGTLDERLAVDIEAIRGQRTKFSPSNVSLVFEGETTVENPNFDARRDTEGFSICIDAIQKREIRDRFRKGQQAILLAVGLSLKENIDRATQRVGEVIYLVDDNTSKPIYTFTLEGGAVASLASPVSVTRFH
jgi:hypothetical protein